MKRYLLTADFLDEDFNLGWVGRRYWTRQGVVNAWMEKERTRRTQPENQSWRYKVKDLRTGQDITPDTLWV